MGRIFKAPLAASMADRVLYVQRWRGPRFKKKGGWREVPLRSKAEARAFGFDGPIRFFLPLTPPVTCFRYIVRSACNCNKAKAQEAPR